MCCGGGGGTASVKTWPGSEVVCPGGNKHVTPDAEVMARARGLSLCPVSPTGMGGQMITRQDVERHYRL